MDIELLASDTSPRCAWQVIDAARQQFITGELVLGTTPPSRVYLLDGDVYFAERSSDGALPTRLLAEAVINHQQLRDGLVTIDGVDHLGRLFERVPSVDRDAVETCVELMTEQVLADIAEQPVHSARLSLYRRQRNGIDRWLSGREGRRAVSATPAAEAAVAQATLRAAASAESAVLPRRQVKKHPGVETVTSQPTDPVMAVGPDELAHVVAEAVRRAMSAVEHTASNTRRISDAG